MIRIDEIYNNVFLPRAQETLGVGLHWFDPFGSVDIGHMVNLPPIDGDAVKRIVFWDQEPLHRYRLADFMEAFRPTYSGPCVLVTSERDSEDVAWAKDTYGVQEAYYFFHGWAALDWYRGYNHSFLWPDWIDRDISRRIFCANNIISGERQHRALLVSGMSTRGLIPGNWVSFPERCPFSGESASSVCQSLGLPTPQGLPLVIDRSADHAHDSHRIDFGRYASQAFCHVVTETVYQGKKQHLTEKTFKPIVLEQPFVLVAPRHSLRYIRSYGFQTFAGIWNESYDDLADGDRVTAVLDLLEEINSWDTATIRRKQRQIQDVVRHNRDWFYGGFQDVLWRELCDMVDRW